LPLVDGQGNFGSMDGDPPAAMRYTESRLAKVATSCWRTSTRIRSTSRTTTTGPRHEPTVLPARFPNLLVNGAGGIAVGMATNIPPHNLGEVIDGCIAVMDNPAITFELSCMESSRARIFRPAASFWAGRNPLGARDRPRLGCHARQGHHRGGAQGSRSDHHHEIPYQVNKATMIEKIAELVRDKRIEGISDIRDESDRQGMRVVIEIKRDAVADVVLNQLYRSRRCRRRSGSTWWR
jgi:DNA gyrase subunit A